MLETSHPSLGFDPCPGDPDEIGQLASSWQAAATLLVAAALQLDRTDAEQGRWKGQAADAFRATLNEHRTTIGKLRASYESHADTLRQWASQLRGFQDQARALGRSAQGPRDEIHAGTLKQGHGATLSDAEQQKLKGYQGDLTDALRRAEQLHQDYLQAAGVIAREIDGRLRLPSGSRGWFGQTVDQRQEKAAADREESGGWEAEGKVDVSGPSMGWSATGPDTGSGKEGQAEAHAYLASVGADGSLKNGSLALTGAAEAYLGVKATADIGATNEGYTAEADVAAGVGAEASGRADYGPVGAYGRADGLAGADTGVNTTLGLEGLNAGAEAFAGAKGGVAGGADIGGIGVGGTAEGWAGAGAEAHVTLGEKDGKFKIGADAGAAIGLGGEVGFEFTVDPTKVTHTVGQIGHEIGSWF